MNATEWRQDRDVVSEILDEVRQRWLFDARLFQTQGDLGMVPAGTHILDLTMVLGRVATELYQSGVNPARARSYEHADKLKHYRDALLDLAACACAAIDEMDQGYEVFGEEVKA